MVIKQFDYMYLHVQHLRSNIIILSYFCSPGEWNFNIHFHLGLFLSSTGHWGK